MKIWIALVLAAALAAFWATRSEQPEVRAALSRATAEPALRSALGIRPEAHPVITLSDVEVRLEGNARARASFRVTVSDSQVGDLHAQPRAARAILSKRSDEWQLESVVVEPEARTAPEPRP